MCTRGHSSSSAWFILGILGIVLGCFRLESQVASRRLVYGSPLTEMAGEHRPAVVNRREDAPRFGMGRECPRLWWGLTACRFHLPRLVILRRFRSRTGALLLVIRSKSRKHRAPARFLNIRLRDLLGRRM